MYTLMYALQIYWFSKILKGLFKAVGLQEIIDKAFDESIPDIDDKKDKKEKKE